MEETTQERPLITFVLFAYNQEEYIREAVEGAFSQTYEPLEIILSDDCSQDQTFKIMQELAEDYVGPHKVRVVQTAHNIGVVAHVLLRGKEASGDIVVVAAGDDISLPVRTEMIANSFSATTGCVFSLTSIISGRGHEISPSAERPLHLAQPEIFLREPKNEYPVIQGCSAAYRSWVFSVPIQPNGKSYAEDLLFSFYINLNEADIRRLDVPLVKYRAHEEALSNRVGANFSVIEQEVYSLRSAHNKLQMLNDFLHIAEVLKKKADVNVQEVQRVESATREKIKWADLSFSCRVKRILFNSKKQNGLSIKWKVMRLWGSHPYYQPKIVFSCFQRKLK
ncbi:glycosyltransferase [Halomonas sp. LR5S13]|uniref:glycosyltransferase n=1 Tax=Halomonas rhizosphaerae TaxID=3043296 RepID=UPI0024A97086|nr:glycosyltransferase [Halomonas rhizosphaerae]MDI5920994.1 glycosyltransferase [Halomonas rhizosphaerae]